MQTKVHFTDGVGETGYCGTAAAVGNHMVMNARWMEAMAGKGYNICRSCRSQVERQERAQRRAIKRV